MVTDILGNGSELVVAGDIALLERAFGQRTADGVVDLPGAMSRKKQVAPRLLTAASR
jgi:manganese-dependent inorganic pyrophosphatase